MDKLTTNGRTGRVVLAASAALALAAAVALGASHEDETIMARETKVTLQQAMATATQRVPGRVTWAAREQVDGGTCVLVQVGKEDRTAQTVTLEDKTGKIVKVEPVVEKPGEDKGEGSKKSTVKGSIAAGNSHPTEYPYLAKVTMQDAINAAL